MGEAALEARAPAPGLDRPEREPVAEMPVQRFGQGVGFFARKRERRRRHDDEAIAHQTQMHRIGAAPAVAARLAARSDQRERSSGERLVLEAERCLQPGLNRL